MIVLKPATQEDHAFLCGLYCDVHAIEFAPLGLPAAALEQLLEMQFRAQRSGYAVQFPTAMDEIIWIGGERAGRMLVNESEGELRLVDIALIGRYRGQGVGGRLIGGLCERAGREGRPLRLSVRLGNPAQRLYQRLGFVSTGGDGMNVAMELSVGGTPRSVEDEEKVEIEGIEGTEASVEQGTTGRYFKSLRGSSLRARSAEGVEVALVLEDVKGMKAPKAGAAVELGDSFVLTFRGPSSPVLPSATVAMTPREGEAMNIFVSPVRQDAEGIEYEATFNRMKPI